MKAWWFWLARFLASLNFIGWLSALFLIIFSLILNSKTWRRPIHTQRWQKSNLIRSQLEKENLLLVASPALLAVGRRPCSRRKVQVLSHWRGKVLQLLKFYRKPDKMHLLSLEWKIPICLTISQCKLPKWSKSKHQSVEATKLDLASLETSQAVRKAEEPSSKRTFKWQGRLPLRISEATMLKSSKSEKICLKGVIRTIKITWVFSAMTPDLVNVPKEKAATLKTPIRWAKRYLKRVIASKSVLDSPRWTEVQML